MSNNQQSSVINASLVINTNIDTNNTTINNKPNNYNNSNNSIYSKEMSKIGNQSNENKNKKPYRILPLAPPFKQHRVQNDKVPLSPISPHFYNQSNNQTNSHIHQNYSSNHINRHNTHFLSDESNSKSYSNKKKPRSFNENRTKVQSIDTEDKVLLTPPNSPEVVSRVSGTNNLNPKKKISSTYEYNNRILMAKRNGNIRVVMNEFISMKKNNVQLTQHTYNLVLEAHAILRKEGTPLTSMMKIYNEMIQAKIEPNAYTYVLMIRTLCKRDVEVQKTVAMLRRQSARIGHENEDVRLLESEHNLDKALSIFQRSIDDGISINTFEVEIFNQLLRVLSHYGNTKDAGLVYSQLELPHVQANPNSATYAALINLYGRAGNIDMALHYYDVYRKVKDNLGQHDTSYIYNALVDCHLKCGRLEGALHVVEQEMVENGIKLTCIPYNSIIRHYCANSQMDEAKSLIDRLIENHKRDETKYPYPDASSYGPILSAYCQSDEWIKATEIYDKLRETDISKAYGNLANYALLCIANQQRDKVFDVIEDMTRTNLEPDPVLAERIIVSFAQADEVRQAIKALEELQKAMTLRTLSKGCHHIINSALEVVLHCRSITEVLQTMHLIINLVKNNPKTIHPADDSGPSSYVIICKTLIDSYFDKKQNVHPVLTTADYQLLFDASFVIHEDPTSSTLGDIVMQLLHDMQRYNILYPHGLYQQVLNQLQKRGDVETEYRWKLLFNNTSSYSNSSKTTDLQLSSNDDDDDGNDPNHEDNLVIEIAEQDDIDISHLSNQYKNTFPQTLSYKKSISTSTPVLHATNTANGSKSEAISNDILKAVVSGNSREAICIFEDKIICRGLIPVPETMRDVIALAGKQGDLQTALTMYNNSIYTFKDIVDPKEKENAIYMATNSLLIGYAQMGDMERAKVYYDRIKAMGHFPDSNGYASMLLGSAKSATDEATDALDIYDEAKRHNVKPTTFFYNVIISKLSKARKLEAALNLFEEMRLFKVPANSITYGAIISASVRSGSETQSRRLFGEMLSSPSYQPRVGPFNNMMQFYVRQCPNRERVLEYFSELRRRHIKPSPHSYKLLMEAYTHIAPYDMPMAHKLLNDMTRCDHLRPQASHYATLIYSYGILQRDVQSAEKVFAEMKKANIQPDEAVYQAMIDTLISNDVLEKAETVYYKEMQKDSHLQKSGSPYIENLFIRGYGEKGRLDKAEEIFEAMSDDKSQHHTRVIREPSTYEVMIRAYLENDKLEKAKIILDKMVKRDFPPKVIGAVADLVLE